MVGHIYTLIETFFKRYGMLALLSFVLGIITVSIVPDEIVELLPFGTQNIYWALIFSVVAFILILNLMKSIFIKIVRSISRKFSGYGDMKRKQARNMGKLWNLVDSLSETDRELLIKFINNGNQPISMGGIHFGNRVLFNSDLIVKTEKHTKRTEKLIDSFTGKEITAVAHDTHIFKLKHEFYQALKYSYNQYGRIGNFD